MILDFNKKKVELDLKKAIIFDAFKNFYKSIEETDKVDIPYFLYAQRAYKENIKSIKDVNKWYNLIMKRGKNEKK